MQTMESDFATKLREALRQTNFILPPPGYMNQVEDELDDNLKEPHFSALQLSRMITARTCGSLVTKKFFNKVKNFMIYIISNYAEWQPGNFGMNQYIKEKSVDNLIRSLLIDNGLLLVKGQNQFRQYKSKNLSVSDDDVYKISLAFKNIKKENSRRTNFTVDQIKFLKSCASRFWSADKVMQKLPPIFKDKSPKSVEGKYRRILNSTPTLKKGDTFNGNMVKGYIPKKNAKLQMHLLPPHPLKTLTMEELVVFYFMYYQGYGNKEIAATLKRTAVQISAKKNVLKKSERLTVEYVTRFLSNNNDLLNKLFKDDKNADQMNEKNERLDHLLTNQDKMGKKDEKNAEINQENEEKILNEIKSELKKDVKKDVEKQIKKEIKPYKKQIKKLLKENQELKKKKKGKEKKEEKKKKKKKK